MKSLIVAVAMLFCLASEVAQAGAKLTAKPIYEIDNEEFKWQLGLSINQQILPHFNYVGWYGVGFFPESHEKDWQKTEQGFEYYWGLLSVGAGAHYTYTPDALKKDQKNYDLYSTVSVKIW